MNLKSLGIENFKGIGKKVHFSFRPITLFFGENSAGKSTILHALNYLHGLFTFHAVNADTTVLGHEAVDLGGFKQFVNGHDLLKKIRFELEIDAGMFDLIESNAAVLYRELYEARQTGQREFRLPDLSELTSEIDSIKIETSIAWSQILDRPYVDELSVSFNDEQMLVVKSSSGCERVEIVALNLSHRAFAAWRDDLQGLAEGLLLPQALDIKEGSSLIGLLNVKDALPDSKMNLSLDNIWDCDEQENNDRKAIFRGMINVFLLGPLELAEKELSELKYLGPIREIPHRDYSPRKDSSYPWADGLAAWDTLFNEGQPLVDKVNHWLNGDGHNERLATGYTVKIDEYKQLEINSHLMALIETSSRDLCKREIVERLPRILEKVVDDNADLKEFIEVFKDLSSELSNLSTVLDTKNYWQRQAIKDQTSLLMDELFEAPDRRGKMEDRFYSSLIGLFDKHLEAISEEIRYLEHRIEHLLENTDLINHTDEIAENLTLFLESILGSSVPGKYTEEMLNKLPSFLDGVLVQSHHLRDMNEFTTILYALETLLEDRESIWNTKEIKGRLSALLDDLLQEKASLKKEVEKRFFPLLEESMLDESSLQEALYMTLRVRGKLDALLEKQSLDLYSEKLASRLIPFLQDLLKKSDPKRNREKITKELSALPVKKGVLLTDTRRGVEVSPTDVGVGISQLLPVAVGALSKEVGLLSIEQPELHIHPRLQTALGDLFIHSSKNLNKSFILETHSEHILLRMLRRIRETVDEELENEEYALKPDDLNIIYVRCKDGETRLLTLEVNEDGEFIDRWPGGFFAERRGELM